MGSVAQRQYDENSERGSLALTAIKVPETS